MPFFSAKKNHHRDNHYFHDDDDASSLFHTFSGRSSPRSDSDYYSRQRSQHGNKQLPLLSPDTDDDVYIVKQRHGYFSIFFSFLQTGILIAMMVDCGIAPLQMNPMLGPYPDALSYWGGKNAYLIVYKMEYWRLLTPIMLHAGVFHLIGNVLVQLDAGEFFEREWGSLTWLLIYLGSAIGSSALSCVTMPNTISVGSSGAVMGLFGAKLSEIFCRACESSKTHQARVGHEVRCEQLQGVLCSIFVVALFSFVPFVDWGAHLGGMLAGWCIGMTLFSLHIKTPLFRLIWFLIGMSMLILYFTLLYAKVFGTFKGGLQPTHDLADVCKYYQQSFPDYVCTCQL